MYWNLKGRGTFSGNLRFVWIPAFWFAIFEIKGDKSVPLVYILRRILTGLDIWLFQRNLNSIRLLCVKYKVTLTTPVVNKIVWGFVKNRRITRPSISPWLISQMTPTEAYYFNLVSRKLQKDASQIFGTLSRVRIEKSKIKWR